MAAQRLSKIQKQMLVWIDAEERRAKYSRSVGYYEVTAMLRGRGVDTSNIGKSVRNLEGKELVWIRKDESIGWVLNLGLTDKGRNIIAGFSGMW